MSELKACPFCGGAAGLCKDDDGRWTQVECLSCGARSNEWPDDEKAPIAAWNGRAPLPTVTREELVDVLTHTLLSCDPADGVIACNLTAENAPHELPLAADAILALLWEKGVIA